MNKRKFLIVTAVSLIVLRVYLVLLFAFFNLFKEVLLVQRIARTIVEDRFHHYQVGILLLLLSPFFWRKFPTKKEIIAGIGTALILDESVFILNAIPGIKIPYSYFSIPDFLLLGGFYFILTLLTQTL